MSKVYFISDTHFSHENIIKYGHIHNEPLNEIFDKILIIVFQWKEQIINL